MELRSVEELMDLLHACRGARDAPGRGVDPVDLHDHALRTAALLRRSRPADKELQVAGLVHDIGQLLRPGDDGRARRPARRDAVRPLLGERVCPPRPHATAGRDARRRRPVAPAPGGRGGPGAGFDAGVLEDWRTVLELVAARNSRLGAVD